MKQEEMKELLRQAWVEVFHTEEVTDETDFFEAGGDSIMAVQLSSWLIQKGVKLDLTDIFMTSTFGALSEKLTETTPVYVPQEMLTKEILAKEMGYSSVAEAQAMNKQAPQQNMNPQDQQVCSPDEMQQYYQQAPKQGMNPQDQQVCTPDEMQQFYQQAPKQGMNPQDQQVCSPDEMQQYYAPQNQQVCTPDGTQQYYAPQNQQVCTPDEMQQYYAPQNQQVCSPDEMQQYYAPQNQQVCTPDGTQQYYAPQNQQVCTPDGTQQYYAPQNQQVCTPDEMQQYYQPAPQAQYMNPYYQPVYAPAYQYQYVMVPVYQQPVYQQPVYRQPMYQSRPNTFVRKQPNFAPKNMPQNNAQNSVPPQIEKYFSKPVKEAIEKPNVIKINKAKVAEKTKSPEDALMDVMKGLLPNFDKSQDFFAQGLTSLDTVKMVTRCGEAGYELSMKDIYMHSNFDELLGYLK